MSGFGYEYEARCQLMVGTELYYIYCTAPMDLSMREIDTCLRTALGDEGVLSKLQNGEPIHGIHIGNDYRGALAFDPQTHEWESQSSNEKLVISPPPEIMATGQSSVLPLRTFSLPRPIPLRRQTIIGDISAIATDQLVSTSATTLSPDSWRFNDSP